MRRRILNKNEEPIIPKENILYVSYSDLVIGEEYYYFTEDFDMSPIEMIKYWDGYDKETEVTKTFIADDDYRSVKFYFKNSPTDLSYMFDENNIYSSDFSELDTSKVTNMSHMFVGVRNIDVSDFDTRNVVNMESAFSDSYIDGFENFNTSKVTNMAHCFSEGSCADLTKWDTSNVTDMSGMFYLCNNFDFNYIKTWDTSNVTDMSSMFGMGSFYEDINLFFHTFNLKNVIHISNIFDVYSYENNLIIDGINTPKLLNMSGAFSRNYCETITIKNWDTSTVTNMGWLFYSSDDLTTVYLDLDMSNLKTNGGEYMFYNCNELIEVTLIGKPSTNTDVYTDMFKDVTTTGTFYYNKNYDYSRIIEQLPTTWSSVPI